MATMEVNVQELLFTQDSIKSRFKEPRQEDRIDDAVDLIIQGKIKVTDFPPLKVVSHEGRLWSLDNRRLWIFKKAKISTLKVKLVPYHHNTRFAECMNNLELKAKLARSWYWPRVRGECRKKFFIPGGARPAGPGFPVPSVSTPFDQSLIDAKRGQFSVTQIVPTTNLPKLVPLPSCSYQFTTLDPQVKLELDRAGAIGQAVDGARVPAVYESPRPLPSSPSPSVQAPACHNVIKITPMSSRPREELPSRYTRRDLHVIDIPHSQSRYESGSAKFNSCEILCIVSAAVFLLWLITWLSTAFSSRT